MGKISFWKRILSYFKEIHVESAPSEFNPHLYVSISRGRYMLSSANAIYSHGDLYTNFKNTFQKVDWTKLEGRHSLILGFGLASIPMILEKMGEEFTYVGVEIDPNVIYLASKYVMPELKSPIHVYEANALSFVDQHDAERFDMICMDIFEDDDIPEKFQKPAFLKQLQSLLKPEGILFVNTLLKKEEGDVSHEKIHKNLEKVFPKGIFHQVVANAVFVSNRAFLK